MNRPQISKLMYKHPFWIKPHANMANLVIEKLIQEH